MQDAETLDPTPLHVPQDQRRPPPLAELVRQMVHSEMLRKSVNPDAGPFEEEDDFEIDDEDADLLSDYQVLAMVDDYEREHGHLPWDSSLDDPPLDGEQSGSEVPEHSMSTKLDSHTVRTDTKPQQEEENPIAPSDG